MNGWVNIFSLFLPSKCVEVLKYKLKYLVKRWQSIVLSIPMIYFFFFLGFNFDISICCHVTLNRSFHLMWLSFLTYNSWDNKIQSHQRIRIGWYAPGNNTEVGSHSFLQEIFPIQGLNPVFHMAGRFFTIWATRETQRRNMIMHIKNLTWCFGY